jgi:porphyrinogen peroxidase
MIAPQAGILSPLSPFARYLTFSLHAAASADAGLRALAEAADGERTVVGLGQSLVLATGSSVAGLRTFPTHAAAGLDVPSTPAALWCWLRGDDRGELLHRTQRIAKSFAPAFRLDAVVDAFVYDGGRDLTGYEDGTENPKGDLATLAAIVARPGDPLDGSSFVAVQQWVHDLDRFAGLSPSERDGVFGRRFSDNEEMDDAPASAHVKRAAQESFEPEAFVVRRSMPWADAVRAGLMFVAFGKSLDAFDAILRRMVGGDDGITDALFTFTRPVSGAYFWCPPMHDRRLDLRALGV